MKYQGKAWRFGENVDTDQIIPSQYLVVPTIAEMSKHTMEPLNPEFAKNYQAGDIIVADNNFGCGSSREQAPQVLKALGVKAIIAPSFARIFFRNAINIGILLVEIEQTNEFSEGDQVEINMSDSVVTNKTTGKSYNIPPMSDFLKNILDCGGLVDYLKRKNN